MKNKLFILILIVCNLLTAYVSGEVPPAKVVFQQYMNQAQTFANNFPREKAYLHFDNTSYNSYCQNANTPSPVESCWQMFVPGSCIVGIQPWREVLLLTHTRSGDYIQ